MAWTKIAYRVLADLDRLCQRKRWIPDTGGITRRRQKKRQRIVSVLDGKPFAAVHLLDRLAEETVVEVT